MAGTLNVVLVNGFTPVVGNTFRIMTFPSHTGDFAAVTGAVTGVGMGFRKNTEATFVELTFVEESCSDGQDNDGDGFTDCADPKCAGVPACSMSPTATPTVTRTPPLTFTPTATAVATSTLTPTSVATRTPTSTHTPTTPTASPTPGLATASPTPTRRAGFNVTRRQAALPAAPIAAATFGGDLAVDLAVGNSAEPSIALLRNDGQANFAIAEELALPGGMGGVSDVLAVDIDGDGFQDVIAANPGGELVAVVRGNGAHQLADPQLLDVGAPARRLTTGDVVGDSALDVLVATDNAVLILRGLGDGRLELGGNVATGARPADLAVIDVDGDGHGDLLVALPDRNLVQIYLGNGAGGFAAGPMLAANRPVALVLAPFTGGTQPDLAVANDQNDSIAVFRGVAGGFVTPAVVTPGVIATRLLAGELTGEQFLDLVAVDTVSGTARVLPGLGNARFDTAAGLAIVAGAPVGGAAIADLDGDASTDVVLTDPVTEELIVALNAIVEPCVGDCDNGGTVEINELVTGVSIAVGEHTALSCRAFDPDGSLLVEVDELLLGIGHALDGCPR